MFLDTLMSDPPPQCLVWLPLMHRLANVENGEVFMYHHLKSKYLYPWTFSQLANYCAAKQASASVNNDTTHINEENTECDLCDFDLRMVVGAWPGWWEQWLLLVWADRPYISTLDNRAEQKNISECTTLRTTRYTSRVPRTGIRSDSRHLKTGNASSACWYRYLEHWSLNFCIY